MIASSAGHLGIVESLLKNSSSAVAMVNEQNEAGQTSLHYAASKGNCNIAEKLISHGADTNVRDRHKATPLQSSFKARAKNYEENSISFFSEGTLNWSRYCWSTSHMLMQRTAMEIPHCNRPPNLN